MSGRHSGQRPNESILDAPPVLSHALFGVATTPIVLVRIGFGLPPVVFAVPTDAV